MQQQELLMHNHAAEALCISVVMMYKGCCMDLEEVKIDNAWIASEGCFHILRFLSLLSSHNLRDMSWVTFAQHLEELSIWQCLGLEEIISWEKHNEVAVLKENSNFFSKLKILDQHYLPKMKTIYGDALPFQQLKEIINEKWPMLKKLPLKFNSAKGRKIVIKLEEKW
ncbi:hypothetical protein Godav_018623 [Gossypium davidsonii]|uniref:Disease resistance protein At4g27190-like leucine-rich repeats domain-containing protein n=1 Tax=Gossypium davidsonii TaxID=34287 RepID=A0A7J8QX03_GOSDV|nr:hypothetical protein [Gossypium davidsonii]